eukprot:TRINITY_DN3871_c0_g6_i1.p1 TRINITY_DN3871_c0_g6~~TRINITY_DN3871_c0_g6_i1.p1  ORF type:complete len:574 (-),score=135.05 TRINITY_DN3871_c0_g6_i1:135-1856(-)
MTEPQSVVGTVIEDLKSDNVKRRISSVRQLPTIASALGKDRTRAELLPFIISELIEDEDDVLAALAESIGDFLDLIGGPAHVSALLPILESLGNNDDTVVREKTTEALRKIFTRADVRKAEQQILSLVRKLATGSSASAKIAASNIIPIIYTSTSNAAQGELIGLFTTFTQDESSVVRKSAALNFKDLVKQPASDNELASIIRALGKDEQEFVRIYFLDALVNLARASPTKQPTLIVPQMRSLADDPSWRVRYSLCDKLPEIGSLLGKEVAKKTFLPFYVKCLQDTESEVRNIACQRMGKLSSVLDAEDVALKVLPLLKTLAGDSQVHVRAALAGGFSGLAPLVGKKGTNDHLVPVFLTLLRDENSEVRVACFSALDELSKVVGLDVLSQSLFPTLNELVGDKNFRVRVSACDFVAALAKALPDADFTTRLSKVITELINDKVFAVRDAAISSLRTLAESKGSPWTERNLLPLVLGQQSQMNYLNRMSTLFGLTVIVPFLPQETVIRQVVPVLQALSKDTVPNIRLNVGKTIAATKANLRGSMESIRKVLTILASDQDSEVALVGRNTLESFS